MKKLKSIPLGKNVLIAGFIVLIIGVVSLSFYFERQYQKNKKLTLGSTSTAAKEQVESLTEKVGRLIVLPEGEDPTVATVSDKSKLQDQRFFARAENGDKVLIYAKAGQAILYRPSINKIIEVGPINLDQNNPSPEPTIAPTSAPTPTTAFFQITPAYQNQNNPLPSATP